MAGYESPDYHVALRDKPFEIRLYQEFFIVEYDNERDPYIENGFGTLFRYISNDNKEHKKIAMTIPVIEEVTDGKTKMAFVVPGMFGDRVPEPNSPNLRVQKFDAGTFAVVGYSGRSTRKKEAVLKMRLADWLVSVGYKGEGNYMLAFYNPPFVPPMFRRNEIMIRVVAQ